MPIAIEEILETIRMTEVEHFDIRTVTMGISLKDCCSDNLNQLKKNIYEKIMQKMFLAFLRTSKAEVLSEMSEERGKGHSEICGHFRLKFKRKICKQHFA